MSLAEVRGIGDNWKHESTNIASDPHLVSPCFHLNTEGNW